MAIFVVMPWNCFGIFKEIIVELSNSSTVKHIDGLEFRNEPFHCVIGNGDDHCYIVASRSQGGFIDFFC